MHLSRLNFTSFLKVSDPTWVNKILLLWFFCTLLNWQFTCMFSSLLNIACEVRTVSCGSSTMASTQYVSLTNFVSISLLLKQNGYCLNMLTQCWAGKKSGPELGRGARSSGWCENSTVSEALVTMPPCLENSICTWKTRSDSVSRWFCFKVVLCL